MIEAWPVKWSIDLFKTSTIPDSVKVWSPKELEENKERISSLPKGEKCHTKAWAFYICIYEKGEKLVKEMVKPGKSLQFQDGKGAPFSKL